MTGANSKSEMSVLQFDGPALVFGGPYSNLQATAAVLAEAERFQIPPRRIICTGDLVGFCGDPMHSIEIVRRAGIHVVMGNCDEQLANDAQDCGCGLPFRSACERLSSAWFGFADRQVGREARAWVARLPRRIDLRIGGAHLAVIHGGVSQINQFVFALTAAAIKRRELALAGSDGVIGGHCGLPFSQVIDCRLWHNPGAVGIPANDGTPRVWYSLLVPVADGVRIDHRALDYDHNAAATAMVRAGLPHRNVLTSGRWPTCDALPYREIREAGVAFEPGSVVWTPAAAARPQRRGKAPSMLQLWPSNDRRAGKPIDPLKFKDPLRTATGEPRASVALKQLATLWVNTGTQCNITCRNCYIELSPAQRPARLSHGWRPPALSR